VIEGKSQMSRYHI